MVDPAKLQLECRTRDLAIFSLAIDSKLRGCDLVDLRMEDVASNGYAVGSATIRHVAGHPLADPDQFSWRSTSDVIQDPPLPIAWT